LNVRSLKVPLLAVRLAIACLVVAGFSVMELRVAQAQSGRAESIEEFMSRESRWPELVDADFRLEGRVRLVAPKELRFKGCNLEFRLRPGLPALPRDTAVVEVEGSLIREGGVLLFDVTHARKRDDDLAVLSSKQVRIDSSDPAAWFELADWAGGRGAFYQDKELLAKAASFRETALMMEYRRLKANDIDGLLALADRSKQLKVSDSFIWRFIHEACRLELSHLRRDPKADDASLTNRIRTQLPGATDPLAAEDLPLREKYNASPEQVYIDADETLRKKLHRILYLDVLLAHIERDAKRDGSNGESIADRIQQQLPELTELASSYRQKELAYLTSRVTRLSREQMLELSKRYTGLKRPDDAHRITAEWLKSQEPTRRSEGPTALMSLADDYRLLLDDQKTSVALAEEAWRSDPELAEPKAWLEARGLVLHDGRWISADAVPAPTEDPFEAAIREGRVERGMQAEQVRQALGAAPTSILRTASREKISELWVYRSAGLVITLARAGSQGEAIVENVDSISR
jgi:hypothetical protein